MSFVKLKASACLLPVLALGVALAAGPGQPVPASANAIERDSKLVAPGAPEAESPADAETRWIAGEWKVKSVKANDAELFRPEELAEARIVFAGKTATVKNLKVLWMGDFTFALDPSKTPKEIDVVFPNGPQKGKSYKGIYVVRQKEMLIGLRLLETHLPRPAGYFPTPGSGLYRFHLEPVEAKPGPPAKFDVKPEPKSAPKLPAATANTFGLSARLVIRTPQTVNGVRVCTALVEIESPQRALHITFDPSDLQLEVADDEKVPVRERAYTRIVDQPRQTALAPAGGYVGFPSIRPGAEAGVGKGLGLFTAGKQDWFIKPAGYRHYLVKGTVVVGVANPEAERGESGGTRVKLTLPPTSFTIPE